MNDKQTEGVLATEGPVLVLAGAGSGKTRLLTYKIAHLVLELGIDPRTILGVTFTNKAAGEMRERAEKLCGEALVGIWLGTFHSVCGRILRTEAEAVKLKKNFSIFDESDQKRLMKDIIEDAGLSVKEYDPSSILSNISMQKNRMITAEDFSIGAASLKEKLLARLWTTYQEALLSNNAVDFDDMILLVVKLLEENKDVREKLSGKFHYILVDEFQDTNRAQYELIRHLSSVHKNITVVGDDDQSIYGWRGAEVRNILEFPNDFPGTKIIRLEQNYRSTGNILKAASCVVSNNRARHPKRLWTNGEIGEKLTLWEVPDEYAEAKIVAESIKENIEVGIKGRDIAVLYRINAHSRLLEDELRKLSIPHVIVGGIRFYERAEIKDVLAYLRIIENPSDDLSFTRVVNMPRRGIGVRSMALLREIAKNNKLSLYDAILSCDLSELSKSTQKGVMDFVDLVDELRNISKSMDAGEIIGEVIRRTGYLKMLEEDGSIEARSRIDNISELVNAGVEFANTHPEDPSLAAYLQEASLLMNIDKYEPGVDSVSLMTVHSAKGLEFDIVYVCGLEEGLFPIRRAIEKEHELEEERRLFYVAITRARKRVHIFCAETRRQFGMEYVGIRSRFIDEIPKELIEEVILKREREQQIPIELPFSNSKRDKKMASIAPGTIVEHPFFGRGEVRALKGWGEDAIVTITFPKYGQKKLLLRYADLSIVRK